MQGNVRELHVYESVERTSDGREFVTITEKGTERVVDRYWRQRQDKPAGRPKKHQKNSFKKVYDANFDHLVDSGLLNNTEFGFFMKLMRFLDWESNYIVHPETGHNMTSNQIGKWLKMDVHAVLEYMTRLNEHGLVSIVKRGGHGHANHYIFNVDIAFRGSKIKDARQVDHFRGECPFVAPKPIRYQQREQGANIDENKEE